MSSPRIRRVIARLRDPGTRPETLRRIRSRALGQIQGSILGSGSRAPTGVSEPTDEQRRHALQARLAQAIAEGASLEQGVCRTVRAMAETDDWQDWNAAWALAEGVAGLPGGAVASALGHALLEHRRRHFDRVWHAIQALPDDLLSAHIPVEAVDGALAAGPAARARALAIAAPAPEMEAPVLVDLAGRMLAFGERSAAAGLLVELSGRTLVELDSRRRRSWELIARWLDRRPGTAPPGSIPIGVLAYRTPDHHLTSGNLGDYVQTLALVGNLARLSDVTYTGDDGLGAFATKLQDRVQPSLRLPGPRASVHLVAMDRDFSSAASVPAGTWLIAFGWHMHPLYDLRYDFPYHENVRPLFLSFHVNRLQMLGEAGLDYLRRHGPIGCRDWNTVFLLLGAGVDAFFSGCVTTTIDGVFPTRAAAYGGRGKVGVIDVGGATVERGNARSISHQSDAYRSLSLTEGLRAADAALAGYQRDLSRAVTGRLHAYLPLTALGVPVEFTSGAPGDVRFAGLTGMRVGDARLAAMRAGIRDLLGPVMTTILSGADEAAVRGRWRELTSPLVAEARARFEAPVVDRPASMDIGSAVGTTLERASRFGPHDEVATGPVADVALSFDQNLTLPAAVLVESIVANASVPVRLWILTRSIEESYKAWLAAAFPQVPMTFLPCDHIAYGPTGRPRRVPKRITVSTMDRLLLPLLLPDVRTVAYLDVDTLMLDDVGRLVSIDLGGHAIAARDSNVSEASEWQRAGRRLPEPDATELRRRMSRQHGFGHPALNAGVLVMDLDRMRQDDFTSTYLGLVERYGLHDQDTMLAYAGPARARLEGRWNAMPVLEDVVDPSLIHWASFGKPWDAPVTYGKDRWQEHAARLRDRAGPPPTADAPFGLPGSLTNPVTTVPPQGAPSGRVASAIGTVLDEHLSYLDATSLHALAATVAELEEAGVPGLLIEAGTARGGSAIVMAAAKRVDRPMRVYDVFGIIPAPTDRDGADVHARYATIARGRSKGVGGETYYGYREDLLGEVTTSFARLGVPLAENNVELVQGQFEDTLLIDGPVALAHLDGDWYSSTMACLSRIAPMLAPGGRLVIDDYDTWSGCRAAVHEYFADRTGFRFERRGRLHVVRLPSD